MHEEIAEGGETAVGGKMRTQGKKGTEGKITDGEKLADGPWTCLKDTGWREDTGRWEYGEQEGEADAAKMV